MPRFRALTASIGLAIVIAGCTSATDPSPSARPPEMTPTAVSTGSPSTSTAPSQGQPSALPSTSNGTLDLAWSDEPFPGAVASLVSDGRVLIAAGGDADGPAVWTSMNGTDWQRHEVPDPTFIAGMVEDFGPSIADGIAMGGLIRLGETLFSFSTFHGFNDFYRPLAWHSRDGISWEFVESESAFYGYGAVTDVETFEDGLLAARATGLIGPVYGLWAWSPDSSWRETTVQSTEGAILVSLDAAEIDGAVVAVGQVAERESLPDIGANRARAWISTNAERWDELALPSEIAFACGVEQTPSGDTAVIGREETGVVSVWVTSDRSTWSRSALEPGGCDVQPLILAGEWLAAHVSTDSDGAHVWLSRDGQQWSLQELPRLASVSAAELDGSLYIIGADPDGGDGSIVLHGSR